MSTEYITNLSHTSNTQYPLVQLILTHPGGLCFSWASFKVSKKILPTIFHPQNPPPPPPWHLLIAQVRWAFHWMSFKAQELAIGSGVGENNRHIPLVDGSGDPQKLLNVIGLF